MRGRSYPAQNNLYDDAPLQQMGKLVNDADIDTTLWKQLEGARLGAITTAFGIWELSTLDLLDFLRGRSDVFDYRVSARGNPIKIGAFEMP